MNRPKLSLVCLMVVVAAALAVCSPLAATQVMQLNLEQMVDRADRIFRGTVLDAREGKMSVGGGELPVVTYRIRVDEAIKGTFEEVKGVQIAEVRMLGTLKKTAGSGAVRPMSAVPDLPRLAVGQDYLLLTTPRSSIGLSTTVGLGQGLFRVDGKPGQETAVNLNQNLGLFRGMGGGPGVTTGLPTAPEGPLPYRNLATLIRDIAGE